MDTIGRFCQRGQKIRCLACDEGHGEDITVGDYPNGFVCDICHSVVRISKERVLL
jgi:hypothetical protein